GADAGVAEHRTGKDRPMRARTLSAEQGMTLIEVMVALALLSLLSVGMVTAFRVGEHAYRQLREADAAEQEVLMAQRFLRGILQSPYPFHPAASEPAKFGIQGDAEDLELTAPMSYALGHAGHCRYWIEVERTASGARNLIVRWALDRHGASIATERETLIAGIEGLEWSYRGSAAWTHTWTGTRALPSLVRLHVEFPAGDSRHWPD